MKMDQSVKLAVAGGVLLGGISLALLFRPGSPRASPPVPKTGDRLVLRKHPPPDGGGPGETPPRGGPQAPADSPRAATPSGRPMATILKPRVGGEPPPPPPARADPARSVPGTSRWGTSIGMKLPNAPGPEEPAQTHKIVDGDSLPWLAERYLGSADRYLEIYEANRDVLPSPQLLPIGAELKILPRRQVTPASDLPARRRLVPIPRGDPPDD